MNDDEVRALVREAIQRHLGPTSLGPTPSSFVERRPQEGVASTNVEALTAVEATASLRSPVSLTFSRYKVQRVSDDGMCLIEPAVRCNHCGYCECHGH